jgi:TolB-like protein/tetratricopeptide (TPR) repeat protein
VEDVRQRRLSVGNLVLDPDQGTLVWNGASVELRPKPFALLAQLAHNAGRVLSKSDLMDAVWPDVIVTEDSLTQAIRQVRVAIGDPDGIVLRTVHGRGYLLNLGRSAGFPAPSGPRVAVLPFRDTAGPAERRPVLDALTEAITSGLARFRLLTVLARNSAFRASADAGGESVEAGRRIGADYVVAGRALPSASGLRVTMELSSVTDGRILWSDGYDLASDEILGLGDLVPRRIVMRLFSTLRLDGQDRVRSLAAERLSAFEHVARGLSFLRSYAPGVNEAARDHFARAIALDPGYGLAHSYWSVAELAVHDYRLAPPEVMVRARAAAEEGVSLAHDDSTAWRIAGYVRGITRDYAAAEMAAQRAISLNPCDAEALAEMGMIRDMQGYPAECLDWIARSEEIDPLFPEYHEVMRSHALYALGRYEEAAESLLRLPRLSVRQYGRLAATYAQMGDNRRSHEALARVEALSPGFDLIAATERAFEGDAAGPHLIDGLRKALAMMETP